MLRETNHGVLLDVEIQPNSKNFEITEIDPWINRLKIRVKESPIKGKANKELLANLKKILGCSVVIKKGEKSTKKTLFINAEKKEVEKKLKI